MEIQVRTITRPSILIEEENGKMTGEQYWGPVEFTCSDPINKVYGKHSQLTLRVSPDEAWRLDDVRIAVYGHEENKHYTAIFDSITRIG
jgi:hypothetical protein